MSGQLVGEVNRNGRALRTAGLPSRAAWTLATIAEMCRDGTRQGTAPLPYLAGATHSSERTASRCLALLQDLGLIVVVRRGGGRGRAGMRAVYRLTELDRWLSERGLPYVASQWAAFTGAGGDSIPGGDSMPAAAQQNGDSIALDGAFRPDSVATTGDPIAPDRRPFVDPVAISDPLTRHPGGDLPVLPGTTPGGTTDVTTGPRNDRPATPPSTPDPTTAAPARDGSLCGRPDCRAPAPCRTCGQVRTAAAQTAADDVAARHRVRDDQHRRRALERAAARARCPQCQGTSFTEGVSVWCHAHQPRPNLADLPGYLAVRAEMARLAAVGAARRAEPRQYRPRPPERIAS